MADHPSDSPLHSTANGAPHAGTARGAAVIGRDLRVLEADARIAELLGRDAPALVGRDAAELLPGAAEALREVLAGGGGRRVTLRAAATPLYAAALPIVSAGGTVLAVELLAEPAAAAGRGEAAALPSLRALLDSLFAFAGLLLPDGTLVEANRVALDAAGLAPDDVLGRPFWETFWWSYDAAVQRRLRESIALAAAGRPVRYDVDVRLGPSQFLTIDFMLAPLRDASGRVAYIVPSAVDIAERKRTELALQQSEERFRATFEHAPVGVAHVAPDGRWLQVNQRLCAIVGYGYDELLALRFQDITHPDDLAADLAHVERLLSGEASSYALEKRYVRRDGSAVWVNLTASLVRDAGGSPAYFIALVEDISRRRAIEDELRFQSQLLDAVDQAVIATSWDGTIRYWNRFAAELYGWTSQEALGRSALELLAAEVSQRQGQEILERLQAGESWSGTYLVRRRGGEVFPAFVSDTPLRDASGAVVGIVGVSVDVSERRRLESEREDLLARERLARREAERTAGRIAELQSVTAALAEALTPPQVAEVIVASAQGALGAAACTVRLVSRDGRALEILGGAGVPPEVAGEWEPVPLDAPEPICAVARGGPPLFYETRAAVLAEHPQLAPALGRMLYEAFAVVPLSVEGRTTGVVALSFAAPRHFTEDDRGFIMALAGQAAQAIARAQLYDAAQEAVRARDTFITVASHDLRSPITVLLGQAQMLERRVTREGLDERAARSARAIFEQSHRLNRMIGSLLDLSRIQSGQLVIERTPLDLGALVAHVAAELQPTLGGRTLEVPPAPAGAWVLGDEVRLGQVLHNLVANAVKYSPSGSPVTLSLAREGAEACIAVADSGIGIPEEALPRLFEQFYRAPNATEHAIAGLGIGLYAVRQIVALHGGSVTVESEEGVGSTFRVRLPLADVSP